MFPYVPQQWIFTLVVQIASLEVTADTAAKERDFYFGKLRDIEILCQTPGLQHDKVLFSDDMAPC